MLHAEQASQQRIAANNIFTGRAVGSLPGGSQIVAEGPMAAIRGMQEQLIGVQALVDPRGSKYQSMEVY